MEKHNTPAAQTTEQHVLATRKALVKHLKTCETCRGLTEMCEVGAACYDESAVAYGRYMTGAR